MFRDLCESFRRSALAGAAALLAFAPSTQAKVTRIVVDTKVSPAFAGASFGTAGQYETLAGRVFGELNPHDQHDYDGINEIVLLDMTIDGKPRKVLVRPDRNGYLYHGKIKIFCRSNKIRWRT